MSNRLRACLMSAAAMCGLGLTGAVHAESLADAIALAYQTNPSLQAQRATQRALDESVVQAKSGFRPSVNLNADATDSNLPGILSDRNSSSGSVSVTQPLYTGGRASAQLSATQADVLTGQQNLRRVESNVLSMVVTAYVDVRRTQEAVRISQENVAVLRRQLEESQARFDVGDVTRTDLAQAQARYAAAQSGLSTTQSNLGIARANYTAVVGQSPGELEPEPSLANLLPLDVDKAFSGAQANSPQILAAEFTEQASRARVAQAKAVLRPSLSFRETFGYSASELGGKGNQFGNYTRSVTSSVSGSVPLFAGGLNASAIRQATERNNADRLTLESTRRTVIQSVTQAWNQLLGARSGMISNQEQVRAAILAYEGVRQEQQVGLRTTLDVLNAAQELSNAQLQLVGSRRDEYVATAAVLSAMGLLEAKVLTPKVPRYDAVAQSKRTADTLMGWAPTETVLHLIDKLGAPAIGKGPAIIPIATASVAVTPQDKPPPETAGPPPLPSIPEAAGPAPR